MDEKLRAMLAFLEKLTLEPQALAPDDAKPLRAAGLSNDAIEEAIQVAAAFNLIDRVADALGFEVPRPDHVEKDAAFLLGRGYL